MAEFAKQLLPVNIEDEMRQSYMDYAMSVIVGRALPDVRDGLKPVHRRVLFAMHETNNIWNRPYVKCARVVGEVMGKYHPHGDSAIYDTLVRMAQPFSLRYTLIDGQGNFGSVDGDAAAAMRYTECRLSKIASELTADIDKETVEFVPNYDGKEREPSLLPARIPNLLVNGSSGIAVGMATNIPPHNLRETIDACLALMDNADIDITSLMQYMPGPDFPTAGIISGVSGINEAYRTGRGRIYVRARTMVETYGNDERERIVVTELPYQVNKARLMEKIAELVKDKKLEGIRELRDESDKDGMRMVIELRRGEVPDIVLNNLYQHTQMQIVYGINCVALVNNQPRTLNLKQMLEAFVRHRREVVTRRTLFELRKARERAHKLEGLAVALANIDPVIALIKSSANPGEAKQRMVERTWPPGVVVQMLQRAGSEASKPEDLAPGLGLTPEGYRLSEIQAQEILDLKLQRLTGLEKDKIMSEYEDVLVHIADFMDILARPDRLMQVIRDELNDVRNRYGDDRRTEIIQDHTDLNDEDLITPEDVVVTLSHAGYAKSQPLDVYRSQRRGGRGRIAATTREEDFVERLIIANTHDTVLCFSNRGKLYWLKVYQFPQAGPQARGKPIINLLPLSEGERITAVLPIKQFVADHYVLMATRHGTVKKTPLADYSRPRPSGIIAVDLPDGDELVGVALTDGQCDVMLFNNAGKAIRFSEEEVRPMGRTARGVRGMRLAEGQCVIALIIPDEFSTILTATANGYGKRTPIEDYPSHGRGGQGVISIQTTERNGEVVSAISVTDTDEAMLISNAGTLIRTPAGGISVMGRNTQGVRLVNIAEGEKLVGVECIDDTGDEESGEQSDDSPAAESAAPDPTP